MTPRLPRALLRRAHLRRRPAAAALALAVAAALPATPILAASTAASTAPVTKAGAIWTIAGTGSYGNTDGPATRASFNSPFGVTVDPHGNVYVGDYTNNKIRKITPRGVVSTLAGTGAPGAADGPAATATFHTPFGVAADAHGDVFVADQNSQKIREVTASGRVLSVAGSGAVGHADGPAAAATFDYPTGVAVDAAGNAYVADQISNAIRRISAGGRVSTLAGTGAAGSTDGPGAQATFNQPAGIAVDRRGGVVVADTNSDTIRRIAANGAVTTIAGHPGSRGAADGPGATATFASPTGVAVDRRGNVYVADRDNNRIRRISPSGRVTTFAGTGAACQAHPRCNDGGPATQALLNGPWSVAVDATGAVYVADTYDKEIRWITPAPTKARCARAARSATAPRAVNCATARPHALVHRHAAKR